MIARSTSDGARGRGGMVSREGSKENKGEGGRRQGRDSVERGSEVGLAIRGSDACGSLEKARTMN